MTGSRPRNFNDVLSRLPDARQSGDHWVAPCPAPGHQTPEGHLTVKDVGDKALVSCHPPGKHTYEDIRQALEFDSLSYGENSSKPKQRPAAKLNDGEAIALLKQIYGLTDATIEHFGIEPDYGRQAWRYAVQGGTRFKKYSRKPPNKYWHTEGISNQFYGLEDIPTGTTEIWLTNGEPAVWVMKQANIPATCGIYGEGQLPENTIPQLKEKAVQVINIPCDLDTPGKRAAINDYDSLKAALKVRIRQLPTELGEKGDVNDLFNWCGRDADTFKRALEGLPEIDSKTLGNESVEGTPQDKEAVTLVCMADVEAESVSWLWCPYIPLGKLTLLEGDPGIGKSWVGLAIATAVSLGKGLPGVEATEPAKVLLASAEDGLGDTIRPRLDAMGADVNRIFMIDGALTLDETGFPMLETYLSRVRPALLIIDPLVAYLGASVNLFRANETRAVMAQLARLAEKFNVAILAVRHLTKGGQLKAIYRGLGSIDFTAACRSVLLAGCDPENPQNRGIVHIKSNLAPVGNAIGFELREGGFYWNGECSLTAGQILATEGTETTSVLDEVVNFLKEELANGPVPASEIFSDAHSAGLSETTVKRAKAKLGIVTRRQGESGKRGGGRFTWALPDSHLEDQKDLEYQEAHIKKIDTLNNSEAKNEVVAERLDPLNHEDALGMPVKEALDLWRSLGAPVIHLGPGENCLDLEKLLSRPDVSDRHLEVARGWLEKVLKRRGEA